MSLIIPAPVSYSYADSLKSIGVVFKIFVFIYVQELVVNPLEDTDKLLLKSYNKAYSNSKSDDKKLEEVIKSLYNDTKCPIELQLDKLDNQTKYEQIFVPESNFIDACRILTQNYGIYKAK